MSGDIPKKYHHLFRFQCSFKQICKVKIIVENQNIMQGVQDNDMTRGCITVPTLKENSGVKWICDMFSMITRLNVRWRAVELNTVEYYEPYDLVKNKSLF